MRFADISGHEEVKHSLYQMVQSGRLPHALLLLGPEGCGKLALALAFARRLLCESPAGQDACGACQSCTKTGKLVHPDLHFSFPTVGSKVTSETFLPQWRSALADNPYLSLNDWLQLIGAENRQGNITRDECANIIRKLNLKTYEGAFKVLLMWMPELLGKEGNRLLKLIEEPPEGTIIILVAEDAEEILNTILSRCQLVKVHPLHDDEVVDGLLRLSPELSDQQARNIAYLVQGDFNEARKLAGRQENNNAPLFLDWMRRCYRGNGVELVNWVEQFSGLGRENQKYFLHYALHFLREYLVLKLTNADRVRLQEDELTTARNLTKVIEFDQVEALIGLFTDCAHHIERNANPKILFLDASIRVHQILKHKLKNPAEMTAQKH